MVSSSSSSSAISHQQKYEFEEKYDVFLSFRGEDVRNTFASYLYAALSANQILTFMDDHELERGDEISPTLSKAIQESKIWVVIFSENYASSTWCLDELQQILECKKRNDENGVVVPIFYGMDPSVVRKQKGSYGVALAQLEERFRDRVEKVQRWRAALTEASNLCGLDSKEFRPESKLVQKIVDDISLKLPKFVNEPSYGHLIGIGKKIKEIELLLSIGSPDVRIVGIWGMGGIGKTTLASVVYQRLSYSQFQGGGGCCFLWNVREEYARHGANHLRKKLLSLLLNDEAILRMDTPYVASPFIFDRLRRKKVLIILDDVDSSVKLEALVEGYNQLAPGSRIIITTRNVQVLNKVADRFYKVEKLNHTESLNLFQLHAFGKKSCGEDYDLLSERVASYANGNPLALKVLGSFFHSKSREEWEIALNKLKIIPNPEIQDVLKISYEGLDDKEIQSIFLDISCLFDQYFTRDHVESVLDASDAFVKVGISVLIERSLIESRKGNELWMHNLIQQMGQAIVRDEHKEPGNRSRLCDAKDVCRILERDTETAAVEGISLNLCGVTRDVRVCCTAFSKMYNLRILKIYVCHNMGEKQFRHPICGNKDMNKFKLYLPQGLSSFVSNKLNYFQWDLYPLKSLPSDFSLENLVELTLRGSGLQKLWNHKIQSLPLLRRMDLSYSKLLTEIPDLSIAPNLEHINLEGCISLVQVLSSIQNLQRLTHLNLNGCSKLKDLNERSTGYLDLVRFIGITNPKSFIQSFKSIYTSHAHISEKFPTNLTELNLGGTSIEVLPPSIECLPSLAHLELRDCTRLKSVSTRIWKLKSLKSLDLSGCLTLDKFPEISEPMENLISLYLDDTAIKELPESIENLVSLESLILTSCKDIEFLPSSLSNLRNLLYICLNECLKLRNLPLLPPSVHRLSLDSCESLKSLPSLCFDVSAKFCKSLENISNCRAPLLGDVDMSHQLNMSYSDRKYLIGSTNITGCEKLDKITRNSILAGRTIFQILSILKFGRMDIDFPFEGGISRFEYGYVGDEIPNWFNYQNSGTSLNVELPPYWNSDNFLGLVLCFFLDQNKIGPPMVLVCDCTMNFKTIDGGLGEHHYSTEIIRKFWLLSEYQVSMKYVKEVNLRNLGLSWRSACGTMASLHVRMESNEYPDSSVKLGVRFVYKEDIERFDEETKRKCKRRFRECCEPSGSEALGSFDEEEDDDELHSKKLKVNYVTV